MRKTPRIFANTVGINNKKTIFKIAFSLYDYREGDVSTMVVAVIRSLHDAEKSHYFINALIKIYDIPIFYLPILYTQILQWRRSGFLLPGFADTKNLEAQ